MFAVCERNGVVRDVRRSRETAWNGCGAVLAGVAECIGERHDGFAHPDGRHGEPACARSGSGIVPRAGKGQDGFMCASGSHAAMTLVLAWWHDGLVHAGKRHGEPNCTRSGSGVVVRAGESQDSFVSAGESHGELVRVRAWSIVATEASWKRVGANLKNIAPFVDHGVGG